MPDTPKDHGLSVSAGQWLVYRDYGVEVRQVAQVTPKLIKFSDGRYPKQINREKAFLAFADVEDAKRFRDVVSGIDGEFNRRRASADKEHNERVAAAREAQAKQIAAAIRRATGAA